MKVRVKKNNNALEASARAFKTTGSLEAKQDVVRNSEALVRYYAGLYSPDKLDEDLLQVAYEGLLKALKRFDPKRGVMFSTYATHCIIGEIRHELRNRGPFKVPDWLKQLQSNVLNATEELAQLNGVMPTLQEIARRMNVDEEGIVEAMQAGCVSLDEIDLSRVKSLRYESFRLPIEDKITVQMSIEKMDRLQQQVIKLIYYEGLTQEETAKILGINQRKVSRLLNRGLKEMRAYVV